MQDSQGFDQWADGYDSSVRASDDGGTYPFAGYQAVLDEIFTRITRAGAKAVLDIGFGTAALTARLYRHGCEIFGQDFSPRMIELAQEKMPEAHLYAGDFSRGLCAPLCAARYDAIVATYSLHHLTDAQKIAFLRDLLPLLREDGCIYIGDVAFATRAELDACRASAGDEWDDEEIYFVFDELRPHLPALHFTPMSPCAGLLTLRR